jgi:uncharacterized membrane protein
VVQNVRQGTAASPHQGSARPHDRLAHPEPTTLAAIVAAYRGWLGLKQQPVVTLPRQITASVLVGAVLDIVLGLAVLVRRFARTALIAMVAISLGYVAAAAVAIPHLSRRPARQYSQNIPHHAGDSIRPCHYGRAMMDIYVILKIAHVIGACVLFGTGLGIAFFHVDGEPIAEPAIIALTVGTTAVVAQPVTGVALAHMMGVPLLSPWLVSSLVLYLFVGACWLPGARRYSAGAPDEKCARLRCRPGHRCHLTLWRGLPVESTIRVVDALQVRQAKV